MFDEESADLHEVAGEVARREGDGVTPESAIDQLKIALHHRHLPKLADAGLVEYDSVNRVVALTSQAAVFRAAVE